MLRRILALLVTALSLVAVTMSLAPARADEHNAALLQALPESAISLAQGLRSIKPPAVPISAKFELDEKGRLSLSIYVAAKGLGPSTQGRDLQELAGTPLSVPWHPDSSPLMDADFSDGRTQAKLMSETHRSLLDIVIMAQSLRLGTVYSVMPAERPHKEFVVLVASSSGRVTTLHYDLMSGARLLR